jgi:hypothetical protein
MLSGYCGVGSNELEFARRTSADAAAFCEGSCVALTSQTAKRELCLIANSDMFRIVKHNCFHAYWADCSTSYLSLRKHSQVPRSGPLPTMLDKDPSTQTKYLFVTTQAKLGCLDLESADILLTIGSICNSQ